MTTYELNGFYGSRQTPCTVLVCEDGDTKWYCVENSVNVNATNDSLEDGVDVEAVTDHDCFTWSSPIETLEELENSVAN